MATSATESSSRIDVGDDDSIETNLENMPCRCCACLNAMYAKENQKLDAQEGKAQQRVISKFQFQPEDRLDDLSI